MRSLKPKKCRICGELFQPRSTLQRVCSVKCGAVWALELKAKEEAKADRMQREKLKTRADWMKEAQHEFNRYIRLRDEALPCVSCGRVEVEWTRGGSWDCGHYLTVGAHSELRFHPLGAAKQCKKCNAGAGRFAKKNGTVTQQYRVELINRIGLANVEWLEGPHQVYRWIPLDLMEIKEYYKEQSRLLMQSRND